MDISHLNFFYFLVYLEMLLLILTVVRVVFNFILGIVLSIFKVMDYKQDKIVLLTEIPIFLILLLTANYLVVLNTSNESAWTKLLFYSGAIIILYVFRLLHQKDIEELAYKENNISLEYFSSKYFKYTFWLFTIFFVILTVGNFSTKFLSVDLTLNLVTWFLNLNVIGKIIPWIAILLLVGTIYLGFGYLVSRFKKDKEHI